MLRIPEPDRKLLWRCRVLNEDISALRNFLPNQRIIDTLARLDTDKLPKKERMKIASILKLKDRMDTKQVELNKISTRAEKAANKIPHTALRKVAKLYCLDCRSICEIEKECSFCKATIYQYIRLLRGAHKSV